MSRSNLSTSSLANLVAQAHLLPGVGLHTAQDVTQNFGRGMRHYEAENDRGKRVKKVDLDRGELLKTWGELVNKHMLPYLLGRLPFDRLKQDGVELDITESKVLAVVVDSGLALRGIKFSRLADHLCIGRRAFNHMQPPTQWDAAIKRLVELGYIEIDGGLIFYSEATQGP